MLFAVVVAVVVVVADQGITDKPIIMVDGSGRR